MDADLSKRDERLIRQWLWQFYFLGLLTGAIATLGIAIFLNLDFT
jgi:hypothetical protein